MGVFFPDSLRCRRLRLLEQSRFTVTSREFGSRRNTTIYGPKAQEGPIRSRSTRQAYRRRWGRRQEAWPDFKAPRRYPTTPCPRQTARRGRFGRLVKGPALNHAAHLLIAVITIQVMIYVPQMNRDD